jgi:hypothetical protein
VGDGRPVHASFRQQQLAGSVVAVTLLKLCEGHYRFRIRVPRWLVYGVMFDHMFPLLYRLPSGALR